MRPRRYGAGESEDLLGEVLGGLPEVRPRAGRSVAVTGRARRRAGPQVDISTKVGRVIRNVSDCDPNDKVTRGKPASVREQQ
jgi:hypothetical protein